VQDVTVAVERERWTQERRRQHTRDLLLDAAEEVFAKKGFEGASLEEIADTAGYTRGAIYKHFGGKEELFLEANARFNERYVHAFVDVIDPSTPLDKLDLKAIARRWRDLHRANRDRYALGAEFNLYVLRHPEIHGRVLEQRRRTIEMIAQFMQEQDAAAGLKTRIPPLTVARLAVAASDGIEQTLHLEENAGDDLHEVFLELLMTLFEPADPPKKKAARKR